MTPRDTLERLEQRGVLSAVDVQLAQVLRRISGEASAEVMLAAALASRAVQRGHVCADLRRMVQTPLLDDDDVPVTDIGLPKLGPWLTALSASKLVSHGDKEPTPLIIDDAGRVYLQRYFDYQGRLVEALLRRSSQKAHVDEAQLAEGLSRLFSGDDDQRRAAEVSLKRRLTVISGGPGTGKTTTVTRILALLQEQGPARVLLLAPTGKAAQRLGESIVLGVDALDTSDVVKARIACTRASTIHRALGFMPATPTQFRYNAESPLGADAVIADEASMIDLPLWTKLVEAVAPNARLIVLGDKDQLVSVEAGAILGDLCDAPALADNVVQLRKSYRYSAASGIGALARAINQGDPDAVMRILEGDAAMPYGEVAITPVDERRPLQGHLGNTVTDGFRAAVSASTPAARLEGLARFRVLCAHRSGALGVETINTVIEQHLRRAGLLRLESVDYDGRPIMITRNDHQLGLFNGDVGIITRQHGRATAWFPSQDEARPIPPSRLPPHETVFAMTVHKSQGSEVDRVALLLPTRMSPILTRELIYTAVSRARRRVDIHGPPHILRQAITRRIERASGLAAALEDNA